MRSHHTQSSQPMKSTNGWKTAQEADFTARGRENTSYPLHNSIKIPFRQAANFFFLFCNQFNTNT